MFFLFNRCFRSSFALNINFFKLFHHSHFIVVIAIPLRVIFSHLFIGHNLCSAYMINTYDESDT